MNFLGLPLEYSNLSKSKVVIIPVPFEKSSSWIWGCKKAPSAILEASVQLEYFDTEMKSESYRWGIHTTEPVFSEDAPSLVEKLCAKVKHFLSMGKFVVTLGGEHTVSIGAAKAYTEFCQGVGILHLDAHTDRRDKYEGNPYSHACSIARIMEFNKNITSVGVRSMDSSEFPNVDWSRIFFSHDIKKDPHWVPKVIQTLPPRVYITIDADVFDPSLVPSVGTPEPGGLMWEDVNSLLDAVAFEREIVGFDVVELSPTGIKSSDFVIAKLIYRLINRIFPYPVHQ